MAALRDKMRMWLVTIYERGSHTNPVCSIYLKAFDREEAVGGSMALCRVHRVAPFDKLRVEEAEWKVEEEFCKPWQKTELP